MLPLAALSKMPDLPDLADQTVYPGIESNTLEFKLNVSKCCLEKLYPTVCAFLNTKGGRIVFGVEDETRKIVGLDVDSNKLDGVMLTIDNIYQTPSIVDEIGNPPAVGQVVGRIQKLGDGRVLLIVDVRAAEGPIYRTRDGTCWYRLSASNYRMHLGSIVTEVRTLQSERDKFQSKLAATETRLKKTAEELESCKKQRDFAYSQVKQVQEEFRTFVGAAKTMEDRFELLTTSLEKSILAQKEETEAEQRRQSTRWWRCW